MTHVPPRARRQVRRLVIGGLHRFRKALSLIKAFEPMESSTAVLDSQYRAAEWNYLRSIEEAPRFGVVSSYCRLLAQGGSVLEIGCGDALLSDHMNHQLYKRFTGVDVSSTAIERAAAKYGSEARFVCADAEDFAPDELFDLIIFNEVLEYFADPIALLQRYEQFVAPPDGHFVVSMFAGLDTARSWHIWKMISERYQPFAHTKVTTQPGYLWNIKAFRAHP